MADGSCLSVSDVYDHAALIGKDIEAMVNQYGEKSIEHIMPKIVYVLEQLEDLAEKCATDQQRIKELMVERESLIIHTKRDEAIQRQLQEKLLYTDGLLSKDKKLLLEKIKNLKQENEVLCTELGKRDNELVTLKTNGALPGDIEVMVRMKRTIDDQRDEIRSLNSQLIAQKDDIEALHQHTLTMSDINEKLRSDQLIMTSKLKTTSDDMEGDDDDDDDAMMTSHSKHETSLQDELFGMNYSIDSQPDQHLEGNKEHIETTTAANGGSAEDSAGAGSSTIEQGNDTSGSCSKDPDRPRYTLTEMQKLLEERNLYKIRMIAFEEELELYKNTETVNADDSGETKSEVEEERREGGVRNMMQKFLGR